MENLVLANLKEKHNNNKKINKQRLASEKERIFLIKRIEDCGVWGEKGIAIQ